MPLARGHVRIFSSLVITCLVVVGLVEWRNLQFLAKFKRKPFQIPSLLTIHPHDDAYLAKVFDRRKRRVADVCQRNIVVKHNGPSSMLNGPHQSLIRSFYRKVPSKLFASESLKLLFCAIPKVGTRNWRHHFEELSRNQTGSKGSSTPLFRHYSNFTDSQKQKMLNSFTKVMFVRDPLERLVSAWRDKLLVYNPYYSKVFGSVIIKRFRPNATDAEVKMGYPTSLREFFMFLTAMPSSHYDVHWLPYYLSCLPCDKRFRYDYIGHLESSQIEGDYISKQLIKSDNLPSVGDSFDNKTTSDVVRSALSVVPTKLVQAVIRRYAIDYELFGYVIPKFQ